MPLVWSCENVINYEINFPDQIDEKGEKFWNNTTYCLVFALLAVGIPNVTDQNAQEVFRRIHMWENVQGAIRPKHGPYTYEEIVKHVGMTTNANSLTRMEYDRKIVEILSHKADTALSEQCCEDCTRPKE
jgi:hypothetical protein